MFTKDLRPSVTPYNQIKCIIQNLKFKIQNRALQNKKKKKKKKKDSSPPTLAPGNTSPIIAPFFKHPYTSTTLLKHMHW
jgi:hypothetical protein